MMCFDINVEHVLHFKRVTTIDVIKAFFFPICTEKSNVKLD